MLKAALLVVVVYCVLFTTATTRQTDADGDSAFSNVTSTILGDFDGNGDSLLSFSEFSDWYYTLFPTQLDPDIECLSPQGLFESTDVTGDGFLDGDEIPATAESMLLMTMNGCNVEPEASSSEEDDELVLNLKIAFIFVLAVLTFGGSLLPWAITRMGSAAAVMEFGCCFAAGVVLGAGLSHIRPDASEAWITYFELAGTDNLRKAEDAEYPFAELIAVATLLLLLFIDKQFVHQGMAGEGGHSHSHGHSHLVLEIPPPSTTKDIELKTVENTEASVAGSCENSGNKRGKSQHIKQAYLFFIALATHSIFDGMSVGVENDRSNFFALLIAVLSHKLLDGFSLGVPVYYAKFGWGQTLAMLVFCAMMTPLGIAIGIAATDGVNGAGGQLAKALILSASLGSFLFISLLELLPGGFATHNHVVLKMGIVTAGWGIMALLALWV